MGVGPYPNMMLMRAWPYQIPQKVVRPYLNMMLMGAWPYQMVMLMGVGPYQNMMLMGAWPYQIPPKGDAEGGGDIPNPDDAENLQIPVGKRLLSAISAVMSHVFMAPLTGWLFSSIATNAV